MTLKWFTIGMNKPIVICFAGATASGKSQLAYALSEEYGLPIFSNDAVRHDVKVAEKVEDINDALDAYKSLRDDRLDAMFERGKSFVYDASVDRNWSDLKQKIHKNNFEYVLISFNLSIEFISRLAKMFDLPESPEELNRLLVDHENFVRDCSGDITLNIDENNYGDRQDLSETAIDYKI